MGAKLPQGTFDSTSKIEGRHNTVLPRPPPIIAIEGLCKMLIKLCIALGYGYGYRGLRF